MKTKKKCHWQPTTAAAKSLNISPNHLRRLRDAGYFKRGTHYRDISHPGAKRSHYQWHIQKISALINK